MELAADRVLKRKVQLTDRVVSLMRFFGLNRERIERRSERFALKLPLGPGQIVFLTGPSGAGKSVLLRALYDAAPEADRLWLQDIPLEPGKALIDCMETTLFDGICTLTRAGLSDAFAMLQAPTELSEGQVYRYRIARALLSKRSLIFADEFCSTLDRLTAAVIACNLRRYASRTGKTFVLASSHDDLLADLWPDVIVVKQIAREPEIIFRDKKKR